MAVDGESIFAKAGFTLPKAAAPASVAAVKKTEPKAAPSIFEAAGFTVPTAAKAAAPQPVADSNYPKPFTPEQTAAASIVPPQPSILQRINNAVDLPAKLLAEGSKHAAADLMEHAAAGWQAAKQGLAEIRSGNYAPSYAGPGKPGKSTNLLGETTEVPGIPQYAPGGVLRGAGGLAAIPGSLVSGPVNALVTRPLTELTGNPDIGDRAGFVANALVPGRIGAAVGTSGGRAALAENVAGTVATAERAGNALKEAGAEKFAPSTASVNALVKTVGPENIPAAVARMREDPLMTLADVSDPVRTAVQGFIDPAQPKVQNLVSDVVKARAAERTDVANSAFTQAMGPSPDVGTMVEGLKARAREAGQKAIQPALENAKPVDVSPVIAAIDKELKPGVTALMDPGSRLPLSELQQELVRFKQKLTTGSEHAFDPQALHRIQSDMGDQAFQLSKSPNPKDRMLGSQLRDYNEKLIDQIDEAAGGAYRPARAKFKDAKDIHEAFDEGFDVLKNRSGVSGFEDRPAALKEWMQTATPEQVVAKRLGVRADIDQKINGVKNGALAGQTITKIPYNQEKLRTLFGDSEANRLISVMKNAEDRAFTNAKLLANSKTAETLAGQRAFKVPEVEPFHLGSLTQALLPSALADVAAQYAGLPLGLTGAGLLATGTVAGGLKKGLQIFNKNQALERNYHFARNALATGPAREDTINALLSHPKVISELKKSSNALVAP
jgi:hypothetical protein